MFYYTHNHSITAVDYQNSNIDLSARCRLKCFDHIKNRVANSRSKIVNLQ